MVFSRELSEYVCIFFLINRNFLHTYKRTFNLPSVAPLMRHSSQQIAHLRPSSGRIRDNHSIITVLTVYLLQKSEIHVNPHANVAYTSINPRGNVHHVTAQRCFPRPSVDARLRQQIAIIHILCRTSPGLVHRIESSCDDARSSHANTYTRHNMLPSKTRQRNATQRTVSR